MNSTEIKKYPKLLKKKRDEQYARNCEMIRTLRELYVTSLRMNEIVFLDNIEGRYMLTVKQQNWLDAIWDDCFFNRT